MNISALQTRLDNALKVQLAIGEHGKSNIEASQAALNVVNFVRGLIQTDGTFSIPDAEGQVVAKFATIDFLNLVKARASNILGKENEMSAAVNAGLEKIEQAYLENGNITLSSSVLKDPALLSGIHQVLTSVNSSGFDLGDSSSAAHITDQIQRLNIVLEESMHEASTGKIEDVLKIFNGKISEERGFTQAGLELIKNELGRAGALSSAKTVFKSGISAKFIESAVVVKEGFEKAILEAFAQGDFQAIESKLQEPVHELITNFAEAIKAAGDNKDAKGRAALELTNKLSKLEDKQKAYAKHLLKLGENLSKEFDLNKIFSSLSTALPSIFGSGILGVVAGYLFGFSPAIGVIGSLVMAALGNTDETVTKGETINKTVTKGTKTAPSFERNSTSLAQTAT